MVALMLSAAAAPPAEARYSNPVYSRSFPDPSVLRTEAGEYFAYGTSTEWRGRPHYFPILRSADLVHWKHVGDAFRGPAPWARDRHWAPSAIQHAGRTYLFYSARSRRGRHCVAVATAARPGGRFRHRALLACGRPLGYIDPFPFIDPASGQAWLYFARADPTCHRRHGRCFISALPLDVDLLTVTGPRQILLGVSEPWETARRYETVENPHVFEDGGRYYLLYSANDWRTAAYSMGYAVGPTPVGPFVKAGAPLLARAPGVYGPGGGSLTVGPSGGLWLVYAARRAKRQRLSRRRSRTLHIDPVSLLAGELFTEGPTPGLHLDP
jgi:beta-xylosidase